jgi:hypothetical protein
MFGSFLQKLYILIILDYLSDGLVLRYWYQCMKATRTFSFFYSRNDFIWLQNHLVSFWINWSNFHDLVALLLKSINFVIGLTQRILKQLWFLVGLWYVLWVPNIWLPVRYIFGNAWWSILFTVLFNGSVWSYRCLFHFVLLKNSIVTQVNQWNVPILLLLHTSVSKILLLITPLFTGQLVEFDFLFDWWLKLISFDDYTGQNMLVFCTCWFIFSI